MTDTPSPAPKPLPPILTILGRCLLFGALLFLLLFMLAYVTLGTRGGTVFILDKVANATGIDIEYGEGTLRDGLKVAKIQIIANDTTTVSVQNAVVKMDWQGLFKNQIHLTDTIIDELKISNTAPPTGEPFDYVKVATPVALRVDNTHIKALVYEQTSVSPTILKDIVVGQAVWQDADIEVQDGKIGIEIDKDSLVQVGDVNGRIALDKDYPLNATAKVTVGGLDEYHIAPFVVKADGSLKRTVGEIAGAYNNTAIAGRFMVQGVDDDAPFWADLAFDRLVVPYADEQSITLTDGRAIASGTVSNIALRLNSELTGKNIPTGRYNARATLDKNGMQVGFLNAETDNGNLTADGKLDWSSDFKMTANIKSQNFDLHRQFPAEYARYQTYSPKILNGKLAVDLGIKDKDDFAWYNFALTQNNSDEKLTARIRQKNSPKKTNPNPVIIDASWQNYVRQDLPDIGTLHTPSGQATITVGDAIDIVANAHITTLLNLPVGDYQADLTIKGDDIAIKNANYQGIAGDLTANGVVHLPTSVRPLSWTINGKTSEFRPNEFLGKSGKERLPISSLAGRFVNAGRLRKGDKNQDIIELTLTNSQLSATLDDQQSVKFDGKAGATLFVKNGELTQFSSTLDGRLGSQNIHRLLDDNQISANFSGTPQTIDITKLTANGKAGVVSVAGKVDLTDGVAWRLHANADKFATAHLHKDAQAIITGDIASTGHFKNGKLIKVSAKMDGNVLSQIAKLPSGKLIAEVSGQNDRYTVKNLRFDNGQSRLTGDGVLDLSNGVWGDFNANIHNFNTAHFVKALNSDLTGHTSLQFGYRKDEQFLNIRTLDIKGQVNGERVLASGKLVAKVDLPDNFGKFYANLKQGAKQSFDLDRITGGFKGGFGQGLTQLGKRANELQTGFAKQDRAFRRLIKELKADELILVYGDNRVDINGNEQKMAVGVNATALSQFVKSMRGQVVGGFILEGDENSLPTIYADLKIANISMPSFALREASVIGKIVNLANQDSSLVVQGNNMVVFGKSIRKVRADLFGVQEHHDIRLALANKDLQMGLRLQGGLVGDRYTGVLSEGRLQTQMGVLNQRQPTELSYDIKAGNLKMASHCWQTVSAHRLADSKNTGALCFRDELRLSPNGGHLDLAVQNLDTAVFTPVLPSDLSWRSRLNGKVLVSYGDKTPIIDTVLYSDNGIIGMRNDGLPDTTLPYERVSFIAKSTPMGLKVRTDIKHKDSGGYADIVIDPYKNNKPIAGELKLSDFNLTVLRPFFPAMQSLGGVVNLTGQVGGVLSRPLIFGEATLTGGNVSLADVPMHLQDIHAKMTIKGMQATLTGQFGVGDGKGSLTGELDWQKALVAKFGVSGDELAVQSPPLVSAKVSPDIELVVRPSERLVDIKGVVSVPQATIRPPEESKAVVGQSSDVTVIDRRQSGNINAILATVAPWRINADIGLDLGGDVLFQGFGAKLPLAGALSLTQSGQGKMQGRGLVQVSERTKVDIIGQNLELNYAQIRFDGDLLNPRLSIEGVRQIDGQTVGVRVTDRVANPNIQIFNDAGLSEQQAMNALATGSLSEDSGTQITEQNIRSQVTNSLAAAGLSLGLQGTRGVTNELGRALGLESLTLDASGNAHDTNVNVTGYISPDLYVRYGVGVFNAQTSLSARYQLTRRVYLETTITTEKVIDAVYRWRFGKKDKK